MRKFIIFTFACALMGLPLTAHADDGTLANDANGYYDFIPADQLDSSFANDTQVDSITPNVAPAPGGHGGGAPGGPGGGGNHGGGNGGGAAGGPGGGGNHGGGAPGGPGGGAPHPGPGQGGSGGGNHGGGNNGGGNNGGGHGGGGFPIPIPIPIPVPAHNWACYSRDRAGHQFTGASFSQAIARQDAVKTCERESNAGHCRLIGCRRY